MPLHVGDHLRETAHLTPLQYGIYMRLICHYWIHGELPRTSAGKAGVSAVPEATFRRNKSAIAALFLLPDWLHPYLDKERMQHEKIKEIRKKAGSIGGTKAKVIRHLKVANAIANATPSRVANATQHTVANAVAIRKKDITSSETEPRAKEEKKGVAEEASKKAVVQPEPRLTASPYLAAILEEKGWVRK
jgi:uncharacterized protein YdaU (DUF1376 family)